MGWGAAPSSSSSSSPPPFNTCRYNNKLSVHLELPCAFISVEGAFLSTLSCALWHKPTPPPRHHATTPPPRPSRPPPSDGLLEVRAFGKGFMAIHFFWLWFPPCYQRGTFQS